MTSSSPTNVFPARLVRIAVGAIAALVLLLGASVPAPASTVATASASKGGSVPRRSHVKSRHARTSRRAARRSLARLRARRARRASRTASISGSVAVSRKAKTATPAPPAAAAASGSSTLEAGFEDGLTNWNTAGVGEAMPTVVSDNVRSGVHSARVVLTGTQDRSELILGGNGGGSTDGMVEFHEGDEYFYGFSFYIDSMIYGHPGAHNLIMQFKGSDEGSPAFGLQLWDYEGDHGEYAAEPRGLWSHGPAMGGDRFLAPVAEHAWHDVVIHFKASAVGAGYYEVFLDGHLIDARGGVSMIAEGASYAYIKDGLYRNGEQIPGTSEIHLDAAKLGKTWESVQP